MSRYSDQDNKIRNRFANDFGNHFKKIFFTHPQHPIDLFCTGSTGTIYKIELKERSDNYTINDFKDSHLFEKTKYNEMYNYWQLNNETVCIFFIYFKEGTLSYNISNRFASNSPDLEFFLMEMEKDHFGDQRKEIREIAMLKFNPALGDKIRRYTA